MVQKILNCDFRDLRDRKFALSAVWFRNDVSNSKPRGLAWHVRLLRVRRRLHGGEGGNVMQ